MLPDSSAPIKEGRGEEVWSFLFPPTLPPRPNHRPSHYPYNPYHRHPIPFNNHQHAPPLTADPPTSFSAQTHSVLSVPQPSPYPISNSPGLSSPVTAIPQDNATYHAIGPQIQNPLVNAEDGSSQHNSSRAASVLGSGRGNNYGQKTSTYLSQGSGEHQLQHILTSAAPYEAPNAAQHRKINP